MCRIFREETFKELLRVSGISEKSMGFEVHRIGQATYHKNGIFAENGKKLKKVVDIYDK